MNQCSYSRGVFCAVVAICLLAQPAIANILVPGTFLLQVTSDAMPGAADFQLTLDPESNLVGLRRYMKSEEPREFSFQELSAGAVLMEESGFNVVKLVGENLDAHHGGLVKIIYLSNALTHSYHSFEMELVIIENRWVLQVNDQSGHHPVSNLFFKGRKFLGKVIGIEDVFKQ
jgi:hypothetical protein